MSSFIEQGERLKKLVAAMHAHFESLTQQRLTLSYQRMRAWDELIRRGYSVADVALVIRWIKAQMGRNGSGYSPSSLQFSRLIQDADLFEDRLNLARKAFGKKNHEGHVEREEEAKKTPAVRSSSSGSDPIPVDEACRLLREHITPKQ